MVFTKEIIVKEMQFKYKITEKLACTLYDKYKENDDLNILINLLFDRKAEEMI